MKKNPYETSLRVCDGTLAKIGKKSVNVELHPVPDQENQMEVKASYIDPSGTQQTLEPGDILRVTSVAGKSAFQVPREWIKPAAIVGLTWVGGPLGLNYIYLKVSESVFMVAFLSVAAAQTASIFYAGAKLNGGLARAVLETRKGKAVIEGDPLKIGLLAGLTHTTSDTA